MTIFGIGNDIVDIRRITKAIQIYGDRFINRLFHANEIALAKQYSSNENFDKVSLFLAKRYAAKEAVAKAMGTGFSEGVKFREIEIYSLPNGRPAIKLHGTTKSYLDSAITKMKAHPSQTLANIHISISDEYPYANAYSIIELIK